MSTLPIAHLSILDEVHGDKAKASVRGQCDRYLVRAEELKTYLKKKKKKESKMVEGGSSKSSKKKYAALTFGLCTCTIQSQTFVIENIRQATNHFIEEYFVSVLHVHVLRMRVCRDYIYMYILVYCRCG